MIQYLHKILNVTFLWTKINMIIRGLRNFLLSNNLNNIYITIWFLFHSIILLQ